LGPDKIGVAGGWLDVKFVAGAGVGFVAFEDDVEGVAALGSVAADTAEEAEVGGGIDEDFEVKGAAEAGVGEDEEAFDEDDGSGRDEIGFGGAAGDIKAVAGDGDGAAGAEFAEVAEEEGGFEGVGRIEV
jgi:hypothetical protein